MLLLKTGGKAHGGDHRVYLPLMERHARPMVEMRGLWVTRFDWTTFAGADPQKIDEIVENVSQAGFNVIFFQVRGTADAYYTPGLEPWAARLSGTLGKDPGFDPLGLLVKKAHKKGIQVHAYLNVYPVWTGCQAPQKETNPPHLYHQIRDFHGLTDGKLNGLQWNQNNDVDCGTYQRISPASIFFDNHLAALTKDIVTRYDIDGIHLDHIRYAGSGTSCDPVSEERYGGKCFGDGNYKDWQRHQVNGTVHKLFDQIKQIKPEIFYTATAWPVYQDKWHWGVSTGYDSYYQDSIAWLAGGYVDGITPMIYTGNPNCDHPYFWNRERWQTLVKDFQAARSGRYIVPGMGANFCSNDDFAEIAARIEIARSERTAGHAIFSYSSLLAKGYFDDLAAGPYIVPAVLPDLPQVNMTSGSRWQEIKLAIEAGDKNR